MQCIDKKVKAVHLLHIHINVWSIGVIFTFIQQPAPFTNCWQIYTASRQLNNNSN